MEDKELKRKLGKVPDVDKEGNPIYKIAEAGRKPNEKEDKSTEKIKRDNRENA